MRPEEEAFYKEAVHLLRDYPGITICFLTHDKCKVAEQIGAELQYTERVKGLSYKTENGSVFYLVKWDESDRRLRGFEAHSMFLDMHNRIGIPCEAETDALCRMRAKGPFPKAVYRIW